jgi:uncharacterized protein YndB with AHSA1/START domain
VAQRKAKASEASIGRATAMRLEIVRIFDAPRALVYEMWATPEHLGTWSAPKGFTIPEARTDFRQGGGWYAHMRSHDGADHRVQGKYLEIVEGARIVMTHAWIDGACNPGPETLVTVTFEDHGKKTKMTFLQEGFTSAAARDGHADGWNQCFDLLDTHLAHLVRLQRAGAPADREMVITRLIDAPRELVFEAFKDRHHISQWWGPNGFTTTTYEMDVRPGGQWLFTMHGPDGTDYPNRIRYTEVRAPEFIAYDHDGGDDNDVTHAFKATVEIASEGRQTLVTLRLVFATKEQREAMAKFGAIEGGNQTLGRLERYLTKA